MHIVTIGDVMLDVLVSTDDPLQPDDDANASIRLAPGGQAANVACWAVALGAAATVIGPRGHSDAASIVAARIEAAGIAYAGVDAGDVGTVVSIVAAGTRTMASDAGAQAWLDAVATDLIPIGADWLHVSGYPLLRAADPSSLLGLTSAAAAAGAQVSVDLASASMIRDYGPAAFAAAVGGLRPDVVFATRAEWDEVAAHWARTAATVVVKDGPGGAAVVRDGQETRHAIVPSDVVDATGAGDALAAGYLVGGIDLAMQAAARCVAQRGAQP